MSKTSKHRIAAIETRYAGHLFRSRLEARWAAWFDLVGITWTYEPFDAAGYIPDFLCRDGAECPPYIVEVKGLPCDDPQIAAAADSAADRVRAAGITMDLIVVGCDPDFRTMSPDGVAVGLVGASAGALDDVDLGVIEEARTRCNQGDPTLLLYIEGIYAATPLKATCAFKSVDDRVIQQAWGEAHEVARWMPVAARP